MFDSAFHSFPMPTDHKVNTYKISTHRRLEKTQEAAKNLSKYTTLMANEVLRDPS